MPKSSKKLLINIILYVKITVNFSEGTDKMNEKQKNIRNFSIIAHIDHGKSTLADRILEYCNAVTKREMEKSQFSEKIILKKEYKEQDFDEGKKVKSGVECGSVCPPSRNARSK